MKLLGHFKNYLSANIATKALGFLSIPVFTRILSPYEYGQYSVFNSYIGILTVLLTLNNCSSLGRYYYEENIDFKSFVYTVGVTIVTVLGISSLLLILFSEKFAIFFNMPVILIYLIPIIIAINVIDGIFQQIYQAKEESGLIAKVGIFKSYIGFAAGVFFILLLTKDKYIGIISANIIIGTLASLYIFKLIKPYFNQKFSKEYLLKSIHYSLPMLPYVLSSIILDQFDRIMINSYKGASETGLYSFAYNIGMLLVVMSGALFQAWLPKYFELMKKNDYSVIDNYIEKMIRIIVLFACFLILYGQEIGMILADSKFYSALSIIPIIVLGYLFSAIFSIYAWSMGHAFKTYWLSAIVLLSGVLNIVLNKILIPEYGYEAAAYTTMVSYFLMATLSWLCNKYMLKQHSTPILPILYATSFCIISLLFVRYSILLEASTIIIIFLKSLVFLSVLYFLAKKYRNEIRSLFTV